MRYFYLNFFFILISCNQNEKITKVENLINTNYSLKDSLILSKNKIEDFKELLIKSKADSILAIDKLSSIRTFHILRQNQTKENQIIKQTLLIDSIDNKLKSFRKKISEENMKIEKFERIINKNNNEIEILKK